MDENQVAQTENETAEGITAETKDSSTDEKYLSQKRRAEKAEAEAKALRAKLEGASAVVKTPEAPVPSISREETILFAKGHTEAEVEYVKKIASIEGTSPLAAAESDLFKTWKKIQDDKKKAEDAQLGAANGSSVRGSEKGFRDTLTPAEHRALFEKKMGR